MLEKLKQSLRISGNMFDAELQDLIDAALLDLKISGVSNLNIYDHLIMRAVITYAKANFGIDNKDSEKYQKAYDMIKVHLSLSGDYNGVI